MELKVTSMSLVRLTHFRNYQSPTEGLQSFLPSVPRILATGMRRYMGAHGQEKEAVGSKGMKMGSRDVGMGSRVQSHKAEERVAQVRRNRTQVDI